MKKDIYIISGLGADERVFQRMDFGSFSPHFIKWILPFKQESIEEYALRLSTQITTIKPTIIGLSFGGIMAIEIAKQISSEKLILISSAKTSQEIPFYYRWIGKTGLYKLVPASVMKKPTVFTHWLFGTHSPFEKDLLDQILKDTDSEFLRWSIDKVVTWKNQDVLANIIHIHGTRDRVIPISSVKCDIEIKDGGHLMTLNKAQELSDILKTIL